MASAFLLSQGTLLQRHGLHEKSIPPLEQALELQHRTLPPDHVWQGQTEYYLAKGFENAGRLDEAAAHFADAVFRLVKHFPLMNARVFPLQAVHSLVLHSYTDLAARACEQIEQAVENYRVRESWTFELLLRVTAAVKGWPVAAQLCCEPATNYVDPTAVWLNEAWVLRYVGDEDAYNSFAAKTLSLGASFTNLEAQIRMIEIASLGSCRFTLEQLQQLESLVQRVQASLPAVAISQESQGDSWRRFSAGMFLPTDLQAEGYSAIGRLHLQLARPEACLSALEESVANGAGKDPYALLIRAACLHRLGRTDEAKAAFSTADSIIKGLLPASPAVNERFLMPSQLYQQVLTRREVAALLGSK